MYFPPWPSPKRSSSSAPPRDDIVFFGGYRIEATAVPEAGYDLVSVDVQGLVRTLSIENFGCWPASSAPPAESAGRSPPGGVTAMLAMGAT